MADKIIQIACPGCNTVFEVSSSLGGQLGECTECKAIFEIPIVDGENSGSELKTDSGTLKVERAQAEGTTNTVKLSRTSIGMMPNVKDNFNFDVVEHKKTRTNIDLSSKGGVHPPPKKKIQRNSSSVRASTRSTASQGKPWWQFWMFWK